MILMMGTGFGGMMGSGFGGWGGSGLFGGLSMVFMGLIPLLLIGLVVWAVLESTRRRDDHPAGVSGVYHPQGPAPLATPTPSSARALLDERYARGDIGQDEYLQRRGDLG
jgi:putative membrane protein